MSNTQPEMAVWIFGVLLFSLAAAAPRQFIATLGRGRVHLSDTGALLLRLGAGVCVIGAVYRILALLGR